MSLWLLVDLLLPAQLLNFSLLLTSLLTSFKALLVQVHLEVLSQTGNLIRCNDSLDSSLELTLGIESLELVQVLLEILGSERRTITTNPLISKSCIGTQTPGRGDCQETGNEILGIARYLSPVLIVELILTLADLSEQITLILFNERWVPPEEDVDNDPERPHVGLLIVRDPFQDFRCHVSGCTTLRGERVGDRDLFGKSKGGIELMGKSAMQEDPQMELLSRYRRKLSMALN